MPALELTVKNVDSRAWLQLWIRISRAKEKAVALNQLHTIILHVRVFQNNQEVGLFSSLTYIFFFFFFSMSNSADSMAYHIVILGLHKNLSEAEGQ